MGHFINKIKINFELTMIRFFRKFFIFFILKWAITSALTYLQPIPMDPPHIIFVIIVAALVSVANSVRLRCKRKKKRAEELLLRGHDSRTNY
jgi:hypothetical protein